MLYRPKRLRPNRQIRDCRCISDPLVREIRSWTVSLRQITKHRVLECRSPRSGQQRVRSVSFDLASRKTQVPRAEANLGKYLNFKSRENYGLRAKTSFGFVSATRGRKAVELLFHWIRSDERLTADGKTKKSSE